MSEMVPEGWVATKLGTLGGFSKGKGISKSETISKGIPCLRYAEIYTNYDFVIKNFKSFIEPDTIKTTKKLFKNDIIFAGSGETVEDIGKSVAFISDHEAYVGGDSIILSPFPDLDSIFLSYQLNDEIRRKQLRKLGQGSSVIHIYPSGLEDMNLVLPPLLEQKKIASILTSVDEVIETTQKQIDKLQDLKKATMNELLTKGIGHTEFKDSELGRIPKSWEVTELKNTTEVINGRAYKLTEWEDSGIPVIRLQNLTQKGGKFYFSNLKLPEKQYCFKDDLLFMWSASFGPYLWWGDKAIYHYHIWKMVPNESRLNKMFLYIYLLKITDKWKSATSGMAMQHLTKSGIEEQKIILPSLSEQRKISKVINSIQTQIEVASYKLTNLKNLKNSLMQDLLTGKVRVQVN